MARDNMGQGALPSSTSIVQSARLGRSEVEGSPQQTTGLTPLSPTAADRARHSADSGASSRRLLKRPAFLARRRNRWILGLTGVVLAAGIGTGIVMAVTRHHPSGLFGIGSRSSKPHVNLIPLSEPFPYGEKPVRGVNIGGWLLLEPFIKPSMFNQFPPERGIVDEWTFCQKLGEQECRKQLRHHFDTFVTEKDFQQIADLGLDHVRIPVGYWALDVHADEPYVQDSWEYFQKGLEWARKYGLRVMVELHTAPGSQNGWNHSGREGAVRWMDGTTQGLAHGQRTLDIMRQLLEFVYQPEYRNIVTLFGVLNEPFAAKIGLERVKKWTKDAYRVAREVTQNVKGAGPILVVHEGFAGLSKWQHEMPARTYDRVVLDVHNYFIFDKYLVGLDQPGKLNFTCTIWQHDIRTSEEKFGPTMVGEFSVAVDDCALYLNGVGKGARWDGSFPASTPAHPGANCDGRTDVHTWSRDYIEFLRQLGENQMDAFERGGGFGWFYWNFKTENGANPQWDYFLGVEKGWLPPDPAKRTHQCPIWPANLPETRRTTI